MLYRDYMPSATPNGAFMELNGLLEKRDVGNLRANLKARKNPPRRPTNQWT